MVPITIEEFCQHLHKMRMQYPGDAEASLKKGANRLTKAIRKASPIGKASHPHKLSKSWRCSIKGYRVSDIRAEIRSTAPHFHLVNRGFQRKTRQGKPVPNSGKDNANLHFLEKTVEAEWDDVKKLMAKTFYKKARDHLG